MITQNKLKIYTSYSGDSDSWARMSSNKEKEVMNDADWSLIGSLLQDIQLVKKGLTSKEFSLSLQEILLKNCDNIETINQLKKIADKQ
jgi:hypothetical protein